jgi:hypothetical protein
VSLVISSYVANFYESLFPKQYVVCEGRGFDAGCCLVYALEHIEAYLICLYGAGLCCVVMLLWW